MKRIVKRILLALLVAIVAGAVALGIFVKVETDAYDASMRIVYDVPLSSVCVPSEASAIARGKHLVEAVGACSATHCHGSDLGGGEVIEMGPVATFTGPNITPGGVAAAYSDAELARLLRHGITNSGHSVRFMPVQDFNWLPDDDVAAMVSYLRTVPSVDRANGIITVKTLGKILDRRGKLVFDVARQVDHKNVDIAPAPSPTKEYGKYVTRLCSGCHGEHLSGGRLPGAPSDLPIPLNLTPDETGLKGWTYADFDKLLTEGVRKNGKKLDPFMPIEAFGRMDETEKRAMYEYLTSLPPAPMGGR